MHSALVVPQGRPGTRRARPSLAKHRAPDRTHHLSPCPAPLKKQAKTPRPAEGGSQRRPPHVQAGSARRSRVPEIRGPRTEVRRRRTQVRRSRTQGAGREDPVLSAVSAVSRARRCSEGEGRPRPDSGRSRSRSGRRPDRPTGPARCWPGRSRSMRCRPPARVHRRPRAQSSPRSSR